MIRKLRIRMTLMVIAVLILVSAGIVLATHLSSEQNIAALTIALAAVSFKLPHSYRSRKALRRAA